MQFELLALDGQRHSLTRGFRCQAHSAKSFDAVALTRDNTVGIPSARVAAMAVESAVAEKRMARQRVTRTSGAKLSLKILAHLIGPIVRCRVRIAVLQN